jgi:hypothetical protein
MNLKPAEEYPDFSVLIEPMARTSFQMISFAYFYVKDTSQRVICRPDL